MAVPAVKLLKGRAGCRIVTRPRFLSARVGSGHKTIVPFMYHTRDITLNMRILMKFYIIQAYTKEWGRESLGGGGSSPSQSPDCGSHNSVLLCYVYPCVSAGETSGICSEIEGKHLFFIPSVPWNTYS